MANKRANLIDKAKRNVRQVNPDRLAADAPTKGRKKKDKAVLYKAAAFSFHPDQLAWIEATTEKLKKAGYPKAGLSTVVQEAVARMQNAVAAMGPAELASDFLASHAQRAEKKDDRG